MTMLKEESSSTVRQAQNCASNNINNQHQNGSFNSNNNKPNQSNQNDLQNSKDRTLFCVNIDQRCTEDILYELFLQAGPIENIVRKPDRNGNLICLITYKHIESCEYAINLFNGINLFNQGLKVQFCQSSVLNANSQQTNKDSSTVSGRDTNLNSRSGSNANVNPYQQQHQQQPRRQLSCNDIQQTPPHTPQQLMAQPLIQLMLQSYSSALSQQTEFGTPPQNLFLNQQQQQQQFHHQQQHQMNRSRSGTHIIDDFVDYNQNRRSNSNLNSLEQKRGGGSGGWDNRVIDFGGRDSRGGMSGAGMGGGGGGGGGKGGNYDYRSNDRRGDYSTRDYSKEKRSRSRDKRVNDRSRSRSPIHLKRNRR